LWRWGRRRFLIFCRFIRLISRLRIWLRYWLRNWSRNGLWQLYWKFQ
jgi:hypothetical protein